MPFTAAISSTYLLTMVLTSNVRSQPWSQTLQYLIGPYNILSS